MTERAHPKDALFAMLSQLERQARLAAELAVAARQQRALVEDGEAQPLLSHLDHRQRLIDAMDNGQDDLERDARILEEKLSAATVEQRQRVFELIECIKSNLAEVLAVDSEDSGRIAARLAEVIGCDDGGALEGGLRA